MGADADPTTLDRAPARRALVGWTIVTAIALLPSVLAVVAVVRASRAAPSPTRITGRAETGNWSKRPAISVATPSGLTQLLRTDDYSPRREQAIAHVSKDLVLSGHELGFGDGVDAAAVRSVARNGETLAFAFSSSRREEARAMLVAEGATATRLPIPGAKTWLMGLRPSGSGFEGYVGEIQLPNAEGDPRAAFLAAFTGNVVARVQRVTVDAAGVHLDASVDLGGFGGKWVSDVLYVRDAPVFVVAGGALGSNITHARPDGAPVALPADAFSASSLRLHDGAGTFVARDGGARPYRRPDSGVRLCAGAGGDLEPIEESTSGDVTTTTGCGHALRVRADGRGRPREVQVDDRPWRPFGSALNGWTRPVADPLGDRWLVRGSVSLESYTDEALVFDLDGNRVAAPSRAETLRVLAGAPSATLVGGVIVSWAVAIGAGVLLVRALRRVRRVRIARASPTSARPGLFTGVLEPSGTQLRITVGGRGTDRVVDLSDEWPRRCSLSGAALKDHVYLIGVLRDPPAEPAAASFREAARPERPTLAPATEPPTIANARAVDGYVSAAFVPLVVALVAAVPLPLYLVVRLGFGPY